MEFLWSPIFLQNIRAELLFEFFEVYYESIKRESKIRGIKKCRCDERLQTKTKVYHESRKRELKRRLINEGRCDERLKRFLFF